MKRLRSMLPIIVAVLVTWVLTTASASGESAIPPYTFVQDSTGQIWIVGKVNRVAIPIYPATDDQIAAVPWGGLWMVTTADGSGIQPGSKPDWAGADPTLAVTAAQTTATPAAEDPVKLSGERSQNTKAFTLRGGNYAVHWEVKRQADSACFGSGALRRVSDSRMVEALYDASLNVGADRTAAGDTQVYNIGGGQYYLAESGSCSWSVTISPQ